MSRRQHWEGIYRKKDSAQLSWFEPQPAVSLRFIEAASLAVGARILDVGGGTSTLVDALLERGYQPGVLDVSAAAVSISQARLGPRAAQVEWFIVDVTQFRSPHAWDLWHDRAVFHFLTEKAEQLAYKEVLLQALGENGQVVLGIFGPEGPLKCSGLDVCRYDADSLQDWLGGDFKLLQQELVQHTTPQGVAQQFLFCRFQRVRRSRQ
jgi:SAM-dependent methyltransferase